MNNVRYSYDKGKSYVLNGVTMTFEKGKVYGIMGRSGSGKTTLLSLISGLEKASDGNISFDGKDIAKIDRNKYRSHDIGVVFQSFNLLNHLTALENVMLSMDVSGIKGQSRKEAALAALEKVGINRKLADRRVLHLSGGEQQRVGIARALSFNPEVIIADEPTGNLDPSTEKEIINDLIKLAHEDGKCVIIVSHSASVSKAVDQIYRINEGMAVSNA